MSNSKWLQYITIIIAAGILFWGCKKPKPSSSDPASAATMQTIAASSGHNEFVFGPDNATTGYRYTELGRQYAPVFNVKNVMNAWNQLSRNKINDLAPTHLYIKFSPQSPQELKAIVDANIPVYTFPLDYEIKVAGDYMRDPAAEPNGIPPLYTCLPATANIPNSSHEILDKLYLLDLRSVVAKKAFELAGEADYYPGEAEEGEAIPENLLSANGSIEEHWNMEIQWGRYQTDIVLPPFPSDPVNPAVNIDNPPSTVANACACSNSSDDRQPSGCIKVEETQWWTGTWAYEGVNDIMADFLGPFFQRLSPMTNANGCYKSDFKIRYKIWRPFSTIRLPVIMTAIFASGKKTVKGLNHLNILEYALPLTHCIWSVQGGGLNNVNITYLRDWDKSHNETKYYACATANNAIYDYDGYAAQDGIMKTVDNIQVLVHKYHSAGSTPMFHKLLYSGSIPAATMAAFTAASVSIIPEVASMLIVFPPDVTIGYNWGQNPEFYSTDQIKEVCYHEYGHVSHYRKAGNGLWEQNINYIAHEGVIHPPYGNAGVSGATRTDLIEMWGYFIGREYAHRRYGANRHSNGTLATFVANNGVVIPNNFRTSWFGENEVARIQWGHIPGGFLHDIRDVNSYNIANGLNETPGLPDEIHGFSILTIFSKLGNNTNSAEELIDALRNNIPMGAGNTLQNYDNLSAGYGY